MDGIARGERSERTEGIERIERIEKPEGPTRLGGIEAEQERCLSLAFERRRHETPSHGTGGRAGRWKLRD
jgi:hypothetical protein